MKRSIYDFLGRVNVIELTADVKREAIALRKAHRFRLPDAIVAATAIVLQAELWTNDAALAKDPRFELCLTQAC